MAGVFNKLKDKDEDVDVRVVTTEEAPVVAEIVYKVKALGHGRIVGLYNGVRISGGEEFVLQDKSQFSGVWMEAIGWDPKIDAKFLEKVRDESLSQQNRDYRSDRAQSTRQSAKSKALAGEATTLSQIGGVAKMSDNKPNKKEEVI